MQQEIKKLKEDQRKHFNELKEGRNNHETDVKTTQYLALHTAEGCCLEHIKTQKRKHQHKELQNQGMNYRYEQKIPKEEI